jgi:hypothetical protein
MIALFEEPYRISINDSEASGGSRTGLLLGLGTREGVLPSLDGIVLLEDGMVTRLPVSTWSIDFRYDAETDRWVDDSAPGVPTDQ